MESSYETNGGTDMSDEKETVSTPEQPATKLYEGRPATDEELGRIRETLPEGRHLIETNPGEFHSLGRLRG